MRINDAHCHFFSRRFFETLAGQMKQLGVSRSHPPSEPVVKQDPDTAATLEWELTNEFITTRVGMETPGTPERLADRWREELDRNGVSRAALISSVPGDEESVALAVARHPARFVGFLMLDPARPDAAERARSAIENHNLCAICLFPAMGRYSLRDDKVAAIFEVASAHPGTAVFVHCGVLTVGIRAKLGLPSPFDISRGNPLHLHPLAMRFPKVPVIIPHFGAGMFREALMVADLCPNIYLDTSSSNHWIKYIPGLSLADVFRRALAVAGPDRLLFGTDSSFFPRGWQRAVYQAQCAVATQLELPEEVRARLFGGNFDRLFPLPS